MLTKRDCILYRDEKHCVGLNELYCSREKCNFYKSEKEYNKYGMEINDISSPNNEKGNMEKCTVKENI